MEPSMLNPLPNKDRKSMPPAKVQDKTPRCKNCFVQKNVYGQPDIGTPLITETITIIQPTEPSIEIARVTRCVVCFTLVTVKIINNAASTYKFSAAGLCRLLKQSRGSNFRLHELQTGKVDDLVEYPGSSAPRPPERERVVLNPNDTDQMDDREEMEAAGLPF